MNMSSSFLKLLLGLSLCVMFTECMPKNENLITDAPDYQEDEAEVNNTTHLTEDGENDYYDTDATEDDKIDEMDGHDENGEFGVVRRTHAPARQLLRPHVHPHNPKFVQSACGQKDGAH